MNKSKLKISLSLLVFSLLLIFGVFITKGVVRADTCCTLWCDTSWLQAELGCELGSCIATTECGYSYQYEYQYQYQYQYEYQYQYQYQYQSPYGYQYQYQYQTPSYGYQY